MKCDEFDLQLDDYLDHQADSSPPGNQQLEPRAQRLQACHVHVESCSRCHGVVAEAQNLRARLTHYGLAPIPQPDAGFYDRALAKAALAGNRKQRNRWVMTGFGSAIAATLMLWVVSSMFFGADDVSQPPLPGMPGITMALEAPHTFNLVFSSADALQDASMTVTLPPGIEVDGFAGMREITWTTSLRQGRNILPLTLIATSPVGGELLATLQHEDDDKIFRLQVSVI